MTVSHSLDAYLEPTRLSFSSPPVSESIQQCLSSDESYPVFSPLPKTRKLKSVTATVATLSSTTTTTSNTLQAENTVKQHRRQSSGNTVSWNDQAEENTSMRAKHHSTTLDPSNVSFPVEYSYSSKLYL